jgi:hypothetical protein
MIAQKIKIRRSHVLFNFITLVCLVGLFSFFTQASTNSRDIGHVTLVKGKVFRIPHGTIDKVQVFSGMPVTVGDHFETQESSLVKVTLVDGSTMLLAPKSKFVFRQFIYQKGKERRANMELMVGQLRANFAKEKLKKGTNITITTKAASLGVRGTEVLMNAIERQGNQVTQAALLSGQAILIEHGKTKKPLIKLTPGTTYVAEYSSSSVGAPSFKIPLGERTHQALASAPVPMDASASPQSEEFALAATADGEESPELSADELAKVAAEVDQLSKNLFLDSDSVMQQVESSRAGKLPSKTKGKIK